MNQDLDNSISNDLYYKDDLQLNENGNIKLYKLVIKMIYDILSPSSLLKSSPSSFSTVLNLPSAETFSQSSSSQSLSGTLKPLKPRSQNFIPVSPSTSWNIIYVTTLVFSVFLVPQNNFRPNIICWTKSAHNFANISIFFV